MRRPRMCRGDADPSGSNDEREQRPGGPNWGSDRRSIGDPSKAKVWIYSRVGPGVQEPQVQDMKAGSSVDATLTGAVKVGSEVGLTSKGSVGSGENLVGWDLHLKGTVLSKTK